MTALFVYLVKVNIALIIFCGGYYAVLRHLTFYTLNRVYLVCAILFATLYPLVDFSALLYRHQEIAQPVQIIIVNWQAPVAHAVQVAQQHNKWFWLGLVFWTGVIVLAARFIMQLLSLYKLHKQSKPIELHQYLVRVISGDINPFSFWKSIYINPDNHEPQELKAILAHEQVHVNEWHTLDILLGELSSIFYWFNPGVWLMKRAIRENIEFITDQKILQSGSDPKAYQYSLLNVTFSGGHSAIVNHFNTSTIKKRIIMMNTKRSSTINLTRYAVLVPAVILLVLVFSVSKAELGKQVAKGNAAIAKAFNTTINTIIKDNTSSTTAATKRKLMILPNAVSALFTASPSSLIIDTPKVGKINNREVIIVSNKPIRDTIEVNNTVAELLKQVPGAYINADGQLTVDQQMATKARINGAFFNNSPNQASTLLNKMNGFSVATNGNVIINKPVSTYSQNGITYYRTDTTEHRNGLTSAIRLRGNTANGTQPLVVVDGKTMGNSNAINQINPKDIESVTVLKEGTSVARYGGIAKGGSIAITTKNPAATAARVTSFGNDPLIIVNGTVASKGVFYTMDLNTVESINVLKDGTAVAKYGDRAKNGVIEVTTKFGNPITVRGFSLKQGSNLSGAPGTLISGFGNRSMFSGKLLLVDGNETTEAELNKIPADKIKVIKPLTNKEKEKYGDKAKNGGFAITTIK